MTLKGKVGFVERCSDKPWTGTSLRLAPGLQRERAFHLSPGRAFQFCALSNT
jgi:hypothetical protein